MAWLRLDAGFYRNLKVRSVSVPARWLYVALLDYCRDVGHQGRLGKDEALTLARAEGVAGKCLDELVSSRLLALSGSEVVIPDFSDFNPPPSSYSGDRVRALRARRNADVTVTPAPGPASFPPVSSPLTLPPSIPPKSSPSETLQEHKAMTEENSAGERVEALVAWAVEEFGSFPLRDQVDTLVNIDVPLSNLLAHLRQVSAAEHPRSLAYFVSGPGIGRLRELESEGRRNHSRRTGGGAGLSQLLQDFQAGAAS